MVARVLLLVAPRRSAPKRRETLALFFAHAFRLSVLRAVQLSRRIALWYDSGFNREDVEELLESLEINFFGWSRR
jgi:hypothetical protein